MRRLNKSWPYVKQTKNRSSKQNGWLCGVGTKPIVRCMSGEQLKKLSQRCGAGANGYEEELTRREKKRKAKADKGA